jgi:hypothetical protein
MPLERRAMLLAICCQPRADAEGLVWQPVLQNVDRRLGHRYPLYAACDYSHSIGSSQGAVLKFYCSRRPKSDFVSHQSVRRIRSLQVAWEAFV